MRPLCLLKLVNPMARIVAMRLGNRCDLLPTIAFVAISVVCLLHTATQLPDCEAAVADTSQSPDMTIVHKIDPAGMIHTQQITSLASSAGGKLLFSGDAGGNIFSWEPSPPFARVKIGKHGGPIASLDFDDVTNALLSVSLDGMLQCWDTKCHELISETKLGNMAAGLAIVAKSSLAVASDESKGVTVFAVPRLQRKGVYPHHRDSICSLTAASGKDLVASADKSGSVHVWNPKNLATAARLEGCGSCIRSMRFSSSANLLAAGAEDGRLYVWNLEKFGECQSVNACSGAITGVEFTGDGKSLITVGQSGVVCRWDVRSLAMLRRTRLDVGRVGSVARLANQKQLAVCSPRQIRLLHADTLDFVVEHEMALTEESLYAISRDGAFLCFGQHTAVAISRLGEKEPQVIPFGAKVTSLAIAKNSKFIYCVAGREVHRIASATGRSNLVTTLPGLGWRHIALRSDETELVLANSTTVLSVNLGDNRIVWDYEVKDNDLLRQFGRDLTAFAAKSGKNGLQSAVKSLELYLRNQGGTLPSNSRLIGECKSAIYAISGKRRDRPSIPNENEVPDPFLPMPGMAEVRMDNIATGQRHATAEVKYGADHWVISPDESVAAVPASKERIVLVDIQGHKMIGYLTLPHVLPKLLGFVASKRFLIVAGPTRSACIMEAKPGGSVVAVFEGLPENAFAAESSSDGLIVYTLHLDGSAWVWRVNKWDKRQ